VSVEDLRAALPPPKRPLHPGTPAAWAAAETALGLTYPPDFKAAIATYGSGTIGGSVALLNPMDVAWTGAPPFAALPQDLASLIASLDPSSPPWQTCLYGMASVLASCSGSDRVPLPGPGSPSVPVRLWPQQPGLFPWARGDSGQALLWWTDGDPARWPVLLADPNEGLLAYPLDMTGLLAAWLAGSLTLPYLPPPHGHFARPE